MADIWLASRPTESGCITRNTCIRQLLFGELRCRPAAWAAGNGGHAERTVQGCGHLGAGARELFYYPLSKIRRYGFRQCEPSIWKPDAPGPSGGKHTPCEGLSLSPDGRWLVRSQIDRALTLVMIAE